MPKLAPGNPAIVAVPADFLSALPSSLTDDVQAPLFRELKSVATFGQLHIKNGTHLAGHLGRALATTVGWEPQGIPVLSELTSTVMTALNTAQLDAIAAMFGQLERNLAPLIAQALEPISEIMAEALTAVPIVGWIAKLGWLTYKGVSEALAAKPITARVALGYERDEDQFVAQQILNRIGDPDWTPLFAPPPDPFRWHTLSYTANGYADGVQWGQLDAGQPGSNSTTGVEDTPANALGLLPGVGDIAGYWQIPRYRKQGTGPSNKGAKWAGRNQVTTQGQLLPSATSLAGQVWANMQRPTPAVGRVDLLKLRDLWQRYGQRLTIFAGNAGGNSKSGRGEWLTREITNAWSWYEGSTKYYDVDPKDVPKVYAGRRLDDLIGYKIDIAWRNAVQAMQTHAGAYMTSASPLVANDVGLQKKLDDTRRDLILGRPDVVQVDQTLVPDVGYRNAIIQAKAKAEGQQGGGPIPQRTPTPDPPVDLPSVGETEGGGGGLLLLAAVGLALAFAHSRRRS